MTTEASSTETSGAETSTGEPTSSTGADTEGPGVSGLEAFCDHYVECGGTYYEDAAACVDASLNYWGACPSRRAALDAFGACMVDIPCRDWSPGSYNPASTPCAEQWQELGASTPCD